MKNVSVLLLIVIIFTIGACSDDDLTGKSNEQASEFVFVEGGVFKNKNSVYYEQNKTVSDFYISRNLVTQKQWVEVMGENPSFFKGDNLPVENVSWYDCIEYCNKRSEKEGLQPYYNIDKNNQDAQNDNAMDTVKWTVTINENAGGYRLPAEAEWTYAAEGGQKSKSYIYSGSNDINEVAFYFRNAGDTFLSGDWLWNEIESNRNRTRPVGSKKSNELGLYDMSGNVREWCFDKYEGDDAYNGFSRVWKGGGWIGNEPPCETSFRGYFEANGFGPDQGFRICVKIVE
ncbi:MAG: formylglycine-generating enzyme family protein [Oscillospiraceae bacterium]|nr:formylglycine-generating enzyme family protein [Oscillospiraceae bacterium]